MLIGDRVNSSIISFKILKSMNIRRNDDVDSYDNDDDDGNDGDAKTS